MEVEQDPPYAITQLEITAVEAPIEFKIERMAEAQTISATEMRIDQLAKQNHFSGSVLVSKKDKTIFAKSVGFSNMERKLPNDIKTKFNLGSMNKMFTAVSIAQLAQQGRLNLNDTIGKYLLSYPNIETSKVTIHQLLTHTGGTGDIFGSDYEKNLEKLNNPKDYIDLYGHRPPAFQPGSRFDYSNYALLTYKLLNPYFTDLVTTGKVEKKDSVQYANGFEDHLQYGVRWFGHSGGAQGINSEIRIYPQSGYIIAVMGNFDSPAANRVAQFIGDRLPADTD